VYLAILEKFQEILTNVNPFFLLLTVLLVGMYVFWRGCSGTRKDVSSVFDVFIISLFSGLVLGRISHIVTNWSRFASSVWYWLPYEKYGNEIYLFRVLPWRFFRVWDWGIDILVLFVGILLTASLWVLFVKKWKWSHVFTTIFFTAQAMLALSFILLGGALGNEQWIVQGAVMLLLPTVLFFLKNSVKRIMIGKKEFKVLAVLDVIFILLTVVFTSYTYLTMEISDIEKGAAITFVLWTLLGIVLYIYDLRKDHITIEKVSSVRVVSSVDINQPVKLPKQK
jgi:hypothetical protein